MKVRVSARAVADLTAIQAYVAADNPTAAAALVARLMRRVRALEMFAQLGRPVAEWSDPAVRELIEGNDRIVYQVGGEAVDVLTVLEGHRRLLR